MSIFFKVRPPPLLSLRWILQPLLRLNLRNRVRSRDLITPSANPLTLNTATTGPLSLKTDLLLTLGLLTTNQYRPSSNSGPSPVKPQCQICMKFGHTAKICYYRFSDDQNGAAVQPPSTSHAYVAQPAEYQPPPDFSEDSTEWILDSGATNHVTSDINNLFYFYAYEGTDNLQIGDGKGLSISNIDFASLKLSTHTINLHNILHVPQFSKNLISLSQLLHDNPHLIIEFTHLSCSFKDPLMRSTLL